MQRAVEDATWGTYRGENMWRRGRNRDGGHYCDLCNKGPMPFAQWQQHESGQKHARELQEYERHYFRIKFEQRRIKQIEALQLLPVDSFWQGDLSAFKAAAFDQLVLRDDRTNLSDAWLTHVRRIQSDLLLIAFTKAQLDPAFGSIDDARESFVAMEDAGITPSQTGGASLHWRAHLKATAAQGDVLLRLVMPYLIAGDDVILPQAISTVTDR